MNGDWDRYPPAPDAGATSSYGISPPTNVLAIIALVGAFVIAPVGIVCGHIALRQIRRTGEAGHGLALAGTIVGYVFTGIGLLLILLYVVLLVVVLGAVGVAGASGSS